MIWVLLLGLVGPALVLSSLTPRFQPALAVQAVVIAHTAIGLARVLTDRTVRVVALGFWLFSYIWLGLAPLAMLVSGSYPWEYRTTGHVAFVSCVIMEAGLLAYSAGSALGHRFVRAGRPGPPPLERLLGRRVAPVRVLLLCGASLAIAAYLVPKQGGVGAFFTSRQALSTADGSGGDGSKAGAALAAWGLSVPAFWALLGLVQLPRLRHGDRLLKGLRWMAIAAMTTLNVVVNNPISNPRFWAGTVLLTLAFAHPALRRPKGFRIAAAAILAVVLVVFPYSDYFRYTHREQIHVVSLSQQFTTNGDYDAYQQIETGLAFQQKVGFQPQRLLGPPLFWLPRAVWPGKPQDTGIDIAKFAGYNFTNLSSPLWIESYLWAGLPAVALVFLALGAVGRRIDAARHRLRGRSGTLAALLVPAFGFYQLILLRGSLLAATAPLALLVVVPLLISRRAAPAAPPPPADDPSVPASSAPRRALV
ncbi:hypothetical protein [Streptantibioticus silvisoli]|uniref:Oligosaccharide repeat unit polymerase n=1 Tax=Streptantibioticus silvisoli TaxID=2705255 RepID=A0ABT6W4H3_9ACTN|nr:hypothetical protein [Streptantibioticus silvisoli]MDI5964416.1 hypothetical protein [Streptantibioticus silvisoli]